MNKKLKASTLAFLIGAGGALIAAGSAGADTVVREVPDNTFGGVYGGTTGFLLGGAAGGPLGAFLVGGASWLAGQKLQNAAGLSGTAYEVEDSEGVIRTARSPGRQRSPGETVEVLGRRILDN